MWTGGVRVILLDDQRRMLMVCQHHDGKDIWMVPGGGIEEGEYSIDAAVRELEEETGITLAPACASDAGCAKAASGDAKCVMAAQGAAKYGGDQFDNEPDLPGGLKLIWHVEEVSGRGQRYVNYYFGRVNSEEAKPVLGHDPEFDEDGQALREVRFMSREEIAGLEHLYPEVLRDGFWTQLENGLLEHNAFRERK